MEFFKGFLYAIAITVACLLMGVLTIILMPFIGIILVGAAAIGVILILIILGRG